MEKKVIQIGGTVRSGTTLLGLILANAPDGMALGEVFHLFYPTRKVHHQKIVQLKKDPIWGAIISDKPQNVYNNIFKYFPRINLITDTSKDPFWFKKLTPSRHAHYDLLRVVAYKTPHELRTSFLKRGMHNWQKVYKNYYRRYFSIFDPTLTVHINTLLKDSSCLVFICNCLGIQYHKQRLNYWEYQHPNFFGSATVKKNKIVVPTNGQEEESTQLSLGLLKVFGFLKSHDLFSRTELFYEKFPRDLKYNKFMLCLLKRNDKIQSKLSSSNNPLVYSRQKTDLFI